MKPDHTRIHPRSFGPRQHARPVTLRAQMDQDFRRSMAAYRHQLRMQMFVEELRRHPVTLTKIGIFDA